MTALKQAAEHRVSAREGYSLWADSYDTQPNPFLALEQRILSTLLPPTTGLDVVDIGCGTGRWLAPLAAESPRSLVGVDSSEEMLSHAHRKLGTKARLVHADCHALPMERGSVDIARCSFVASYLSDLDRFAEELFRVCRNGARVFITDLHPGTCAKHGWRRSFKSNGKEIELATREWSIDYLLFAFERAGFRIQGALAPRFGRTEEKILRRAGLRHVFMAAEDDPALVVFQLRAGRARLPDVAESSTARLRTISKSRIALNASQAITADLRIDNEGRIEFLGEANRRGGELPVPSATALDLGGHLVLPGLINAHDHLDFALFPRLGKGPYNNYMQWADHIHQPQSSPVREHRSVPKDVRLWWGGIRNLLAGVTTVCHHNPFDSEVFDSDFPVAVLRDFDWAHSLALGGPALEKKDDLQADRPFVIHLSEGIDELSASELQQLDRLRGIDDRTVIVHGLAVGALGRKLLNSRNAALVWCPTSNYFLFGRTHSAFELLQFRNVAIGSDSSLTAAGDLLDEIRFAHQTVGVSAAELYAQATTSPSRILRLKSGEGALTPNSAADLIAVRDQSKSPAATLAGLSYRDIELVVRAGIVRLASSAMMERLPRAMSEHLVPLEIDGTVRWLHAPLGKLFASASNVLGCRLSLGGRRLRHVASEWI